MTADDVVTGIRVNAKTVEPVAPWTHTVLEPATGKARAELVGGAEAEARQALEAASVALPGWSETAVPRRAAALRAVAAQLRDDAVAEPLAVLISKETGKRIAEARAEVGLSATFFEWFADAISVRAESRLEVVPGLHHEITEHALGVVAVLSPWNFPLSIPARKIAPALAAGCTVLFKPSEVAPSSALWLAELVEQQVPAGTINTAVGDPTTVSDTWLADRRVRGLTFTGSTRVGRLLASATADAFTRCVLELGGNAPFVVLDDASLDRAVQLLMVAKYRNNGQSCIAANQVWVPRARLDDFAEAFRAASENLVLGDPLDESTTLGPLALPGDPARVDELAGSGGDVVRADVAVPRQGHFARPAISVGPGPDSRVAREEIFGPAVSVHGYDSVDDVVSTVREGQYGLGGYVVGDPDRANRVARALDVGIVGVNTGSPNHPRVPFAGLKDSGIGVEGGYGGLEAFLTSQTIAVSDR